MIFQEAMGLCGVWQDKIFPTKSLPYFSDLVRSFRSFWDESCEIYLKSVGRVAVKLILTKIIPDLE